jgi:hypothetical protein
MLHFAAQGLKRVELRDELYMQLVKQTRSNPNSTSRARAWALFNLVASAMPPSKDFTGLISEYVHTALQVSEPHAQAKSIRVSAWRLESNLLLVTLGLAPQRGSGQHGA